MASLTLVRRIRARPAIVFEALSTPEGLTNWWGPDDFPVVWRPKRTSASGGFRVRFRTGDGREHEYAGEFLELREPG